MLCIRLGTAAKDDGFPVTVDDVGTRRNQDTHVVSYIQGVCMIHSVEPPSSAVSFCSDWAD